MQELLRTADPIRLSWAIAVLKDEGIESFVLDTHISSVEGSIGAFPRRLAVRDEDGARAERILRDAEAEIR
jgi:hypothetical protein